MKFCIKCGTQNEDFYNYCSKDGESLNIEESNLMLKENEKQYCDLCGTKIKQSNTYCPNCGKMLSEIGMKTKYKGPKISSNNFDYKTKLDFDKQKIAKDTESIVNNIPDFFGNITTSLKNFDYINFSKDNVKYALTTGLVSTAFTAILPLIMTVIILGLISQDTDMASLSMNMIGLSGFKIFCMNIISMFAPKYIMFIISDSINFGMALRQIVTPLIVGLSVFAATNITFKRKNVNSLPMAVFISLIYSLIMVIISLFARYSMPQYISIYATVFSVFINSFIIAFVGSILSLERENSKRIGTVSNIFKFNLRIVISVLGAITVLFTAYIYIKLEGSGVSYSMLQSLGYFGDLLPRTTGIGLLLFLVIALFIMSPWIFLMMNLVSLKMLVISNSIFSTGKGMLLVLVPIIIFIFIGRMIKTKYGEDRNDIVVTHSLCYSGIMFLLSYFSKCIFSGDLSVISEYLNPLEDLLSQEGEYMTSIASGYIGMSCFMTIIITFIFSIVFIYAGYKTKKTN